LINYETVISHYPLPKTSTILIPGLLNSIEEYLLIHILTMTPQPRLRTSSAKAAALPSKPTPLTSEKPKSQRVVIKVKTETTTLTQLLTSPITPATKEDTPSRHLRTMAGTVANAVEPPQ
jgi:hypothetical protein